MEDKRERILDQLDIMMKGELISKQFFKARAYEKVIDQIKHLPKVTTMNDLEKVSGIGPKIRAKIEEILKTDKLRAAEKTKMRIPQMELYNQLLGITNIGVVKAKELIEVYKIQSLDDLESRVKDTPSILTDSQRLGLQYYRDIALKIPRKEAGYHLKKISKLVKEVKSNLLVKLVGSYRRGAEESSDLDIILTTNKKLPDHKMEGILKKVVGHLKDAGYLVGDISVGSKKYMGIAKLSKRYPARRIDILLTSLDEYPFALLYFTGDFQLNIQMRKRASELGFSLNESGLVPIDKKLAVPYMEKESEIFRFLGYRFLQPKKRSIDNLVKLN